MPDAQNIVKTIKLLYPLLQITQQTILFFLSIDSIRNIYKEIIMQTVSPLSLSAKWLMPVQNSPLHYEKQPSLLSSRLCPEAFSGFFFPVLESAESAYLLANDLFLAVISPDTQKSIVYINDSVPGSANMIGEMEEIAAAAIQDFSEANQKALCSVLSFLSSFGAVSVIYNSILQRFN